MSSTTITKGSQEQRDEIIENNRNNYKAIYIVPNEEMMQEDEYGYYIADENEKITAGSIDDKLYSYEDAKIKCGILYSNMRLAEGKEILNKTITSIPGIQYKVINTYYEEDPSAFIRETILSKDISTDFTNAYIQSIENTDNLMVEDISIEWFAYIVPNKTETWTFEIQSDRASYLWVGDHALYEYSAERANIKTPANSSDISVMTYQVQLNENEIVPFRVQFGNPMNACTFNLSIKTASNDNMEDLMNYFVLYLKNNDIYEFRRIFYCLKKNAVNNRDDPTEWKIVGDLLAPIRRNEDGEIECMSNNAWDCQWKNTRIEANNAILNPVLPTRPNVCRPHEYAATNHWCYRANKVIPKLSTSEEMSLFNLYVLDTEDPETMKFIKLKNRNSSAGASQNVRAKVAWYAFDPLSESQYISPSNTVLLSGTGLLAISSDGTTNNITKKLANLDLLNRGELKTSCALKFDVVGNRVELNLYRIKKPRPPPPPPPLPRPIIRCWWETTRYRVWWWWREHRYLRCGIEWRNGFTTMGGSIQEGATDSIQIDTQTNTQYPISESSTPEYKNLFQQGTYEQVKNNPCNYTLTQRDVRCLMSKFPELTTLYMYKYGRKHTLEKWNLFWKNTICSNSNYNNFVCPTVNIKGQNTGYTNDRKPKRPIRIRDFPVPGYEKVATVFRGEFPNAVPSLKLANSNNNVLMFCEDIGVLTPKVILKKDNDYPETETEFILKSLDNRFCLKFDKNGNLVIVYFTEIEKYNATSKKGKLFVYTKDINRQNDYGSATSFYFYKILPNTPIMGRTLYVDLQRQFTSFIGPELTTPISAFITAGDFYPSDQNGNLTEFPGNRPQDCETKCLEDKNCSSFYHYKVDGAGYCKYNTKEIMEDPVSLYSYKSSSSNITDSVLKLRKSEVGITLNQTMAKIPFHYYVSLADVNNANIPPLNYQYLVDNKFIGVASLEEMIKWRKDTCTLLYGENSSNCSIYNSDAALLNMESFSNYQEGFGSSYGYDSNSCEADPAGCVSNFLNRKIAPLEKMNQEFVNSQQMVSENVGKIRSGISEYQGLKNTLKGNSKYEYDQAHEIKINKINIEDVAAKDARDLMQTHNLTYAFGTLASVSLVVAAVYLSKE